MFGIKGNNLIFHQDNNTLSYVSLVIRQEFQVECEVFTFQIAINSNSFVHLNQFLRWQKADRAVILLRKMRSLIELRKKIEFSLDYSLNAFVKHCNLGKIKEVKEDIEINLIH